MASLDLTAVTTLPAIRNVTLSGTPGEVRLVLLPPSADVDLSLRPVGTDAVLLDHDAASLLDEGDDIASSAVAALDHDIWQEYGISRHGGTTRVGLASTTASQVVQVILNRRSVPQ